MLSVMDRGSWVVEQEELWAHSRFGVIRASTLEQLGVSQTTTYQQCQPGGRWLHLLPGIVLLARSQPTVRQRIEAALLHARHDALVTGFEAARLYGLRTPPDVGFIHLLLPHNYKVLSSGFAVVERTKSFPTPWMRDGVPLAPPERAVLDGVRRVRNRNTVRSILIEAAHKKLADPFELRRELDTGTKRGTALPRRVLNEIDFGVRSVAEADALQVWRGTGLPSPHCNVPLFSATGEFIGMPDFWCDEVAFAWEIDSYQYHSGRDEYANTLSRNARYMASGVVVLQTSPARLRDDPDAVVAEIRAGYRVASDRPRPPVQMRAAGVA